MPSAANRKDHLRGGLSTPITLGPEHGLGRASEAVNRPNYLTPYHILLINNGLLLSPYMTREQAKAHIQSHPKFKYKAAAL